METTDGSCSARLLGIDIREGVYKVTSSRMGGWARRTGSKSGGWIVWCRVPFGHLHVIDVPITRLCRNSISTPGKAENS